MAFESIQPAIQYCKENPFFVVGCAASAVANPLLFAATTILGGGIAICYSKSSQSLNQSKPSNRYYHFTEFNPFYGKISGLSASVLAIACHFNKGIPVSGIAFKVFSIFNGIMFGCVLTNFLRKKYVKVEPEPTNLRLSSNQFFLKSTYKAA
ncbi:MAG: hypothetical protein WC222_12470 [Parachlamydiales bacterium]|jgi:hypothetical protein